MKVLVACEFSGIVREAFRKKGHDAWSCDLLPTEIQGNHIQGDIRGAKYGNLPGGYHQHLRGWLDWDLLIAHPDCTYLSVSGARWWAGRKSEQQAAIKFVKFLASLGVPRIAIENPIGRLSTVWRKPDQIIQPWQFGHGETKATCLWLKNLPLLQPTNIVEGRVARVHREPPSKDRWKNRSRTLLGIAEAMATQWNFD